MYNHRMSYGEMLESMQAERRHQQANIVEGRFDMAINGLGAILVELDEKKSAVDPDYKTSDGLMRAGLYRDRGLARLRRALHPQFAALVADVRLADSDLTEAEGYTAELESEMDIDDPQLPDVRREHGMTIGRQARLDAVRVLRPSPELDGIMDVIVPDDVRTGFLAAHQELVFGRGGLEGAANAVRAALFESAAGGGYLESAKWAYRAGSFSLGLRGYADVSELPPARRDVLAGLPGLADKRQAAARLTNWRTV